MRITLFDCFRLGTPALGLLALPALPALSDALLRTDLSLRPVVVIASPWSDPTEDIKAAGGWQVAPRRALLGVLAASDDPAFRRTLGSRGYWTLHSTVFARLICGATP